MYLINEQPQVPPTSRRKAPFRVETILEKGSGALNEDVLLEAGNMFGVFDGATSLDGHTLYDGLSGGLMAARTATSVFQRNGSSLVSMAEQANDRIRQALLKHRIPLNERHRLWSTSMAVIRLEDHHLEYCQTGDTLILFVHHDGRYRLVTPDIDIDRETLCLWQKNQASAATTIQELLAEQIQQVRLQMNINYGVLNGEPEALNFLRHGCEDLAGVSDILLFTDGLFLPRENPLEDSDWDGFVQLYRRGGLQAIRNQVRRLQQTDPDLKRYPRFKVHDDIAAVAIRLNNQPRPALPATA